MTEAPRRLTAEFVGAFALTFLGGGAIILTSGKDLVAIGLAHGLAHLDCHDRGGRLTEGSPCFAAFTDTCP